MLDGTTMIQMIGNFGFPIMITIYLLHRFENRLDSLKSAIEQLSKNISEIEKK